MEVTQEMLNEAMKKAVETGLVSKHMDPDTYLKTWGAMKECLEAAQEVAPVVGKMIMTDLKETARSVMSEPPQA
jgi:DNA-binding HxlR family transcriptional regulator